MKSQIAFKSNGFYVAAVSKKKKNKSEVSEGSGKTLATSFSLHLVMELKM